MIKFNIEDASGCPVSPTACFFGITEALAGFISTFLATDVGVGVETAATLGNIGAGSLEGGVIGAVTNPKNPLKGAEFGAISGGVGAGVAPLVGDLGLGATATDAISGALGGAAGGLATGGNVATSALEGGLAGGISGALKPASAGPAPSTGATSAVSTAAPAGVSAAPAGTGNVTITPPGPETVTVTGEAIPGSDPSLSGAIAASGVGQAGGRPPKQDGSTTGQTGLTAPAVTPGVDVSGIKPSVPALSTGDTGGVGSGVNAWLKANPWAVPAAGLGIDAIKGNQALPGQKALESNANALNAQGRDLQGYLKSGTLPPGLQLGIKQASDAAKASIRSMYAASGQSGSSAEQQDLAAVDERASAQGSQIALNLLQQGVSEQGMANQLYLELMGQALQQDQQLGQAIASFSSALIPSGGGGGGAAPTAPTTG